MEGDHQNFAQEAPLTNADSGADRANGENEGNGSSSLSDVGEATLIQESEEELAMKSDAEEEDKQEEEIEEGADNAGDDGHNNQVEEANDNPTIVKIIRIESIIPPQNNSEELIVNYLALRSDGTEVIVDSKYIGKIILFWVVISMSEKFVQDPLSGQREWWSFLLQPDHVYFKLYRISS